MRVSLLFVPLLASGLAGQAAAPFPYAHARHLLMRAGFGGTPREIARLQKLGRATAVDRLVDYARRATTLGPHGVTPGRLPSRAEFRKLDEDGRRKLRQKIRREDLRKFNALRGWWIDRMLRSNRPFEEKMTLFWHGLFTSGYRDVRNAHHMAIQNDLFRKFATGNFATLVQAVAKDPAMLEYLDNNRNNRRAPNENFAREVMELFTLGEGNYTEKDIKEAARAFTGWTFRRGTSEFFFAKNNHDFGEKTFLGQTGRFNGEDVIRIILEQEAAPRHLARKLLTFFAVEPTPAELEPYAKLLASNHFELKPFFTKLFTSDWFYSARVMGSQVKSPVVLAVSTLRMMDQKNLPPRSRLALAAACRAIGQDLLQPPNVKGWDGGPAWITTSNLLARCNLTRAMIAGGGAGRGAGPNRNRNPTKGNGKRAGKGRRRRSGSRGRAPQRGLRALGATSRRFLSDLRGPGITNNAQLLSRVEQRFLSVPLSPARHRALLDFLTGEDGSPALDVKDRSPRWAAKVQELIHLLTTTPEFQIC